LPTGSRGSLERDGLRVAAKKPATKQNQIAINVVLDIPDSLFTKPALKASITLPQGQARESVITADVASNIAEIIQQQLGVRLEITEKGGSDA